MAEQTHLIEPPPEPKRKRAHPEAVGRRASKEDKARDGGQERPQRVHTPEEIWNRIDRFWTARPDLGFALPGAFCDPCSSPDALRRAPLQCYPDHANAKQRDGLAIDWPERTFWNPPWGDLITWMAKALQSTESIGLFPVRTRRPWWRRFMGQTSAHVMLTKIRFVGHAHDYPGDVMLALRTEDAASCRRFGEVFGDLGGYHFGALHYAERSDRQTSLL